MKQRMVIKNSNGKKVDLAKLNRSSLIRLHYEEEKFMAQRILNFDPFSKERCENLQKLYNFANTIMPWYKHGIQTSNGANARSVEVVCDFLRKNKRLKLLYEAGVGVGFSCRCFVKFPSVQVKGCDVVISDEIKQLMGKYTNLSVDEDTLYESLKKVNDNSIDFFYADNVIEHLLPDELLEILILLSKKMKKGGLLFLVIPNRLIGPHDVSRYFVKKGEPAEGAHFMEMSYSETLNKFEKVGIKPAYFTWMFKGHVRYIKDDLHILNKMKIRIEHILHFFIKKLGYGEKIFQSLAMSYYILVQK